MDATGTLFRDKKFWLSQKVPQRKRFVEEVRDNGGEIVLLEKQADIKIVDHARKEALPGTYSFKYIEQSIRNGELENLEDYAVGPPEGTVRSVGSIIQPARSGRTKFTKEDDQELWGWVAGAEYKGGATSGNELYKQLETKGQPQPTFPSTDAPPTPPSEQVVSNELFEQVFRTDQQDQKKVPFTKEDAETLLEVGEDIMKILPENLDDAWIKFAEVHDEDRNHSAQEWRDFWECSIQALYLKRKGKATSTATEPRNTSSETGYETAAEDSKPVALVVTPPPPTKATQEVGTGTRSSSSKSKSPKLATHNKNTTTEIMQEEFGQSHDTYKPKSPSMESGFSGSAIQREIAIEDTIQEYGQNKTTPRENLKRKRGDIEEDFPLSSPPEALRATKRLHLGEKQPPPVEIASTPERTSEREEHQSPTRKPEVIDLRDDEESEESNASDYYHDELPDNPSPLGRSASQTLSDAGQPISKTQAAFREPSPLIDFDVPAPEQGWDDDDDDDEEEDAKLDQQGSPESGDETPDQHQQQQQQQMLPDTQALLADKTQVVDFDLPEPEGGWGDLLPSSPPGIPPSLHPSATEDSQETDYDAQIDRFFDLQAGLGRSEEDVTAALKCTSMDPDLSEKVLVYMAAHGGEIPSNTPGVWTEEDDEALDSVENKRIMRVQDKHGEQGLVTRWNFLNQYRAA
ncbi:MAG: hypothetical protein Q9167_004907 [Letrouitia subvulpina]